MKVPQVAKVLTRQTVWSALVFSVPLGVYILTLSPTVNLSDSGELAAVCRTLGIAHPTGYPTYTLLGHLFASMFFPPVLGTNFMSAFFGALAVLFLAYTLVELGFSRITAAVAAFLFAFNPILWDNAVITEVYSFSAVAIWATVFVLARWLARGNPRHLILAGFLYGFSFTGHMSALLWLPGIAYLLWSGRKYISGKTALLAATAFLVGLTPYIYLPLRAAAHPVLNWGDPETIPRLVKHLTGWQYRVWMFSRPMAQLGENLKNMVKILTGSFGLAGVLPLAGTVLTLLRARRQNYIAARFAVFSLLVIAFDIIYAMNYEIPDIAPYYLPAVGALAVLSAGMEFFPKKVRFVGVGILTVGAAYMLMANFGSCDQNDNWAAREYGENVITFAPSGSLLILGSWDMFSPAVYLQTCEGVRPDITLVDFSLLKRSWYVEQLVRRGIPLGKSADRFLEQVAPFESGEKYDPAALQGAFEAMIDSLIHNWRGAVYAFVPEDFFRRKYKGIPEGFLLRVDSGAKYRRIPPELFEIKSALARRSRWDDREKVIYGGYVEFFLLRAAYDHKIGALDECEKYLEYAYLFAPEDAEILKNILTVQVERGDYASALKTVDRLRRFLPPDQIEILRQDLLRRQKAVSGSDDKGKS